MVPMAKREEPARVNFAARDMIDEYPVTTTIQKDLINKICGG